MPTASTTNSTAGEIASFCIAEVGVTETLEYAGSIIVSRIPDSGRNPVIVRKSASMFELAIHNFVKTFRRLPDGVTELEFLRP